MDRHAMRRNSLLAAALLGAAATLAPAVPASAATTVCRQVAVPVSLTSDGPRELIVRGTLCTPPGWGTADRRDLDLLLAGSTYTRSYWDWPVDRDRYSVVERTLRSGRATLAIDRVGTGASSRPASVSLTLESDAHTVHQVVAWVRAGTPVDKITLIGHSLGSGVALVEAATYHDVDRIVLTGMLHSLGSGLTDVLGTFRPAATESLLSSPLGTLPTADLGYLTTAPGTRGASFFHAASADPEVIAYDEAHKDVVAATELGGYPTLLLPPDLNLSRFVDVPVLSVAGRRDVLLCGGSLDCTDDAAVRANELPYYPQAPSVDTLTVPETGHDLALHPSGAETFAAIDSWIRCH
jgi:pimeloyl-ACP methyl ester carboxylesterase